MKQLCTPGWLVIAVASTLPSCFDGVPSGTDVIVSCAQSRDCPSPLTCDPFIARCVNPNQLNEDAPSVVGAASLSPASGSFGTTFELLFELDGDVADDPVIVVNVGDEALRWTASDETDRVARRWSFTFSPSSGVPAGRYPVRGAWFGENGTASEAQTLGEIVVDIADDPFVVADPAIVGDVVVSPAVGDHSARFVVSFELDADLGSDPEVFLDGTEETA